MAHASSNPKDPLLDLADSLAAGGPPLEVLERWAIRTSEPARKEQFWKPRKARGLQDETIQEEWDRLRGYHPKTRPAAGYVSPGTVGMNRQEIETLIDSKLDQILAAIKGKDAEPAKGKGKKGADA